MSGLTMITTADDAAPHRPPTISMIREVVDRLNSMRQQERSDSYQRNDYISSPVACSPPPPRRRRRQNPMPEERIDRESRTKMIKWCYQVSDFCNFQRETVAIAISYLDRFLATNSPRAQSALYDKKEFQLIAITCLYISIKLFEPLAISPDLLAEISSGCYAEVDIVRTEQDILKHLKWCMNGPTTHAFINHIMELLPSTAYGHDEKTITTLLDFSRYQADIAVLDYDLSLQQPSTLALSALLNSIEGIEKRLFPAHSRFQFLDLISEIFGLDIFSPQVNAARARLLDLFQDNSGYEMPQIANLTPVIIPERHRLGHKLPPPVSVVRFVRNPTGSFGAAKCA